MEASAIGRTRATTKAILAVLFMFRYSLSAKLLRIDLVLLEKPVECRPADLKLLRGLADIPPIPIESLDQRVALGAVPNVPQRGNVVLSDGRCQVQIGRLNRVAVRENRCAADLVLEFPHISRPGIRHHGPFRVRAEPQLGPVLRAP